MADPHFENVHSLMDRLERKGLKSGGGGGNSRDMEARIAKLEASVSHLERDMSGMSADVKTLIKDVAGLKGEVSRLPGYPGLLAIATIIVAAVGLLIRFLPAAHMTP